MRHAPHGFRTRKELPSLEGLGWVSSTSPFEACLPEGRGVGGCKNDTLTSILLWGVAPNPSYFLYLDIKKVTKERSRLQIILGLLFFVLPTQYNSSSFVLLRQYCLLKAHAASLKTVALTQNSLRPFEIRYYNRNSVVWRRLGFNWFSNKI
jgi:hypothetical protein